MRAINAMNRLRSAGMTGLARRLAAVAALWALVLPSSRVFAGDTSGIRGYEEAVYASLAAGDFHALYNSIEKLLLRFPSSAESQLYVPDLVRLADVYGYKRVRQTLETLLRLVGEENGPRRNLCELSIKMQMEKLLARFDRVQAEKYSMELPVVRKWLILGPYRKYGAGDLEHPFLPEIARGFEDRGIGKKSVTLKNSDGILDFNRYLYPRNGVAYASTTVYPRGPVKIRIYSQSDYRIFINGREVLSNSRSAVFRSSRVVYVSAEGGISIMVKVLAGDQWNFRILITDAADAPVMPETRSSDFSTAKCDFIERPDYPYEEFVSRAGKDKADAGLRLGGYFRELESPEAVRFLRQAEVCAPRTMNRYLLAECLIEISRGDRNSAYYLEGWKIMLDLARSDPEFIPAAHRYFQYLVDRQEIKQAYNFGRALIRKAPRYLPLRIDFCEYLKDFPSEKELMAECASCASDFPESPDPLRIRAEFLQGRNMEEAAETCRRVLDRGYDETVFRILLSIYNKAEKFDDALRLIETFNSGGRYDDERIHVLFAAGRYDDAKRRIFESLVENEDAASYLRLGLLSYLQDEDPAMNWARSLLLDPSNFTVADLLDTLMKGKMEVPLAKHREAEAESLIGPALERSSQTSSRVILRGKIYLLNSDGSSRAFCEEIIRVGDQRGVERWGEYRISLQGTLTPVRFRVYQNDGSHTDSYTLEKVNGYHYINLPSLNAGSVIHLSYLVEDPFSPPGDSGFVSIPFTSIQEFDEAVDNFYLKVLIPGDIPLRFCTSPKVTVASEKEGSLTVHSIRLKNLPAIKNEAYAGNSSRILPFFAASSFSDHNDFILWYKGLMKGSLKLEDDRLIRSFAGKNVSGSVEKVFTFVEREVELLGDVLYLPGVAMNTAHVKRGTAEDKVILAKAILDGLGIRSYLAFARSANAPDIGEYMAPDAFTHILLYVPLTGAKGWFLDFSTRYNGCGVVSPAIERTGALVIVGDGFEIKTVTSRCVSAVSREHAIRLDTAGNGQIESTVQFFGDTGRIRNRFANTLYREEAVHRFMAGSVSLMSLHDFRIENFESATSPLRLTVRGSGHSLATAMRGMMIIQPVHGRSAILRYVISPRREHPLVMEGDVHESERYVYRLPGEFRGEAVNGRLDFRCRFGYASITINKTRGAAELIVEKEVHVPRAEISTEEYEEFLDFCRGLSEGEQQRIILQQ